MRFDPNPSQICSDSSLRQATLTVNSDSPGEEALEVDLRGIMPCPDLVIDPTGLTGEFAFPPTVADTNGSLGCFSERSAVIRNAGECSLSIDDISAISMGGDFTVTAPTVFPVVLPPGEETLGVTVQFIPQSIGNPLMPDEFTSTLTIISNDPDADPGVADLCGEGVAQSGIRVVATDISSGTPEFVDLVESISIRSKGKKTPSPINLQFTNVAVQQEIICGNTVRWHVDQETLSSVQTTGSNPNSSYQVSAKQGNLQDSQSFNLGQCDFLEFQLQFQDSDSSVCLLAPKGASCSSAGECCSGRCKGPTGSQICR